MSPVLPQVLPPPPQKVERIEVEHLKRPEELIATDPFAQSQYVQRPSFAALGTPPPVTAAEGVAGSTFRKNPAVNGLTPISEGWQPDYSKRHYGIELDPDRIDEVGYMKEIMRKVHMGQRKPPPTDEEFRYLIPKMLTSEEEGISDSWLEVMINPPPDAPLGLHEPGEEYWPAIRQIMMMNISDEEMDERIAAVLGKKKKKKKKAEGAAETGGPAAATGGTAGTAAPAKV